MITANPDHEVEEDDLTGVHVVPVRRGVPFPSHVAPATIFAFDVITNQEMAELRKEARQIAIALGADMATLTTHDDAKWLIADTDAMQWGQEVPNYDLGNPAHTCASWRFCSAHGQGKHR